MLVLQLKIGERVVERLAIELRDIGPAPFMIGVATPAFLLRGFGIAPVKARFLDTIRRDFLVTIEAQFRLRLFRKRLMTFPALGIELGMPLNQLPGHDQMFEQRLCLSGVERHGDQPRGGQYLRDAPLHA